MSQDYIILFRAVSLLEFRDLMESRRFRIVGKSMEGKWFAVESKHAEMWGKLFYNDQEGEDFRLVAVRFQRSFVDTLHGDDFLDEIGPGYFASIEQLDGAEYDVQEVTDAASERNDQV